MSDNEARLLWAIAQMIDLDNYRADMGQGDGARLNAFRAACAVLIAGYDFEEQEK